MTPGPAQPDMASQGKREGDPSVQWSLSLQTNDTKPQLALARPPFISPLPLSLNSPSCDDERPLGPHMRRAGPLFLGRHSGDKVPIAFLSLKAGAV